MHRYSLIQKRFSIAALTVVLQIGLLGAMADAKSKDKSKKTETERSIGIYLLSHKTLPGTTVSDIAPISNPDRQLIQLTDNVHGTITLLDVSRPKQPEVLEKFQLPAEFARSDVQTFVGNTTLLKVRESAPSAHADPAVALLSFADPSDPKTLQKFEGVTALWTDRSRELIYLSNAEGLWILEIYSPEDKRQEEHLEQSLYKEE